MQSEVTTVQTLAEEIVSILRAQSTAGFTYLVMYLPYGIAGNNIQQIVTLLEAINERKEFLGVSTQLLSAIEYVLEAHVPPPQVVPAYLYLQQGEPDPWCVGPLIIDPAMRDYLHCLILNGVPESV